MMSAPSNPMIAAGQVHGVVAQNFGQAVLEHIAYDVHSGQALCGSFMDYVLPRANDLPMFPSEFEQSQPCTHNSLGAKAAVRLARLRRRRPLWEQWWMRCGRSVSLLLICR